jgi:hypothetical protein
VYGVPYDGTVQLERLAIVQLLGKDRDLQV